MSIDLEKKVFEWIKSKPEDIDINSEYYCQTRDIFTARLHSMISALLKQNISEELVYKLSAIAGEIGNNSYDHNLGNWPDVMGVFFAYDLCDSKATIILADRGLGIQTTLKKVKPQIKDDKEALHVAFTERISGRSPESRGNGLKYVRKNINEMNMRLEFYSGNAKATIDKDFEIKPNTDRHNGCIAIIKTNI
ncbi:hypothetical protein KAR26_02795 [Candidatus Parcubacteria bacterium]|nr:hypothetical protein [Candidatus Parcubacteria bacterium]